METLSITTALPEGSTAFVFGSFLTVAEPSDLDVLLLYDPTTCDPRDAYRAHAAFLGAVKRASVSSGGYHAAYSHGGAWMPLY